MKNETYLTRQGLAEAQAELDYTTYIITVFVCAIMSANNHKL